MKIFLTGSRDLTDMDKTEIENYLSNYGLNHEIHILCDKGIENEILKYFIMNENKIHLLHIHTFQSYSLLPSFLKQPIDYLKSKGAKYHSFNMNEKQITREPYTNVLNEIIPGMDLTLCFYNGDYSKRLIPVDVSKANGIDAMVYELPQYDAQLTEKPLEQKVRVV